METNQLPDEVRSQLGQAVTRTLTLERGKLKVNEEERTVELAFSSETPVERWGGYEILDHSPKACDLRRMNIGGPVLLCHDKNQQVGAVVKKTARIDDDKVGRATVKFSRSQLGTDTMQDVMDEIRETVSCRYIPREIVLEKSDKKNGDTYRVTKWEVLEISFENIPADITVGVGRSTNSADETIESIKRQAEEHGLKVIEKDSPAEPAETVPTTEERQEMADKNAETTVDPQVAEARSVVERARAVTDMGEVLGEQELARTMAAEGKSVEEFRKAVFEQRKAAQDANKPAVEDPNTSAHRNGGGTSLARVQGRVQLKAFRGEGAEERAFRAGHFLRAALFNNEESRTICREKGIAIVRAHSESDNESGGFLVPTEFENVMIDLRLEYGVFRRNANVVPMASLRKERPRRKGGLTAYPIGARGENRRLTESKKGWDRVGLDAKKWGVLAKYEDELSEDSVISMADDLTSEMAYAFTKVEDECGFNGDGTSAYHGIIGIIPKITGLHATHSYIASLVQASGNLWSEIALIDILTMVGRLPSFARKSGQVKWYCSNEFWATVLVRLAFGLGGNALAQIQNEVEPRFLGKPVEIVEVMPHVEANSQVPLLYGNLAQGSMFGDRRGVTVKMTDSNDTDFEEDLMAIKATERFDINNHDVGNANSNAANRQAGPIIALETQSS